MVEFAILRRRKAWPQSVLQRAMAGVRSTPVADHSPAMAPTRERSSDKGTIAIGFVQEALVDVTRRGLDAHALLAAKKSRRAAAQNLRQKGLAAGEIQQALDAVYTPDVSGEDPELEAAAALVEGHYRKKLEAGRRDLVIAALQRRGFSYSVIKEAIRRIEEE